MLTARSIPGCDTAVCELLHWLAVLAAPTFVLLHRVHYRISLRGMLAYAGIVSLIFAVFSEDGGWYTFARLWWDGLFASMLLYWTARLLYWPARGLGELAILIWEPYVAMLRRAAANEPSAGESNNPLRSPQM